MSPALRVGGVHSFRNTVYNLYKIHHQTEQGCYPLPPEELLEEVVRLRLSAPISLLTMVRRSVDILFLNERRQKCC